MDTRESKSVVGTRRAVSNCPMDTRERHLAPFQSTLKNNWRSILLYLFVVSMLSFSWMFKKITVPNERTRVYLAVSIVDDFSLSIDHSVRRFGKTTDISKYNGKYYTDKAPGSSFVGALIYGAVRLFSPSRHWPIERLVNLMRNCIMIPFGILGFGLLRRFLIRRKLDGVTVNIVSVAWILGTSAFHYSTVFYGHQLAAVGFLAAVNLVFCRSHSPRTQSIALLGAGAAAGFSGLMEFQSTIPAVFILMLVAWRERRLPSILLFLFGAMPFAIALFAYNWACFGGPLELSYHHLASQNLQHLHELGIGGVSIPKPVAIFGSLFSLHRGLIATSPIFLLFPIGIAEMWKRGDKECAILILGITVYYLLFIFSADAWDAGWSFGPRLLVPMMALSVIGVGYGADRLRTAPFWQGVAVGLCAAGVIYHQMVQIVFPELPVTAHNPIKDVVIAAVGDGIFSPNLVSKIADKPVEWSIWVAGALLLCIFLLLFDFSKRTGLLGYLGFGGGLAIPAAILAMAILLVPPAWNTRKTEKFLKWMQRLEQAEYPAAIYKDAS